MPAVLALVLVSLAAPTAPAIQIKDIVRQKGAEYNVLTGMGLVIGLNGTGDGDFDPTKRAMAEVLKKFIDANTLAAELADAKNIAVVQVSVNVPAHGAVEGDRLRVNVAAIKAKSLAGGQLLMTPLLEPPQGTGHQPRIFAIANGRVTLEKTDEPTVGVIEPGPQGGAQMVRPILSQLVDAQGRMTLVLNDSHANWIAATNLADQINAELSPEGPTIAVALDPKRIVVQVPAWELKYPPGPGTFVKRILESFVHPDQLGIGAKVVINQQTGTIVMGGEVVVSPMLVTHENLKITTLTPTPPPDPFAPTEGDQRVMAVDPAGEGGTKLADLQAAFEQLKVDAQDRIEILKAMHRAGYLHAELILE